MAACLHSKSGSVECGHVTNSPHHDERATAENAIKCAQDAAEHRHPFTVIFSGYGIDEQVSNAVVGDSAGNAIEIVYATGMIVRSGVLQRHRCDTPIHFVIEENSAYGFPWLHCAKWPPERLENDFLIW